MRPSTNQILVDHVIDRFYVLGPFTHETIKNYGSCYEVHDVILTLTYYSIPVREPQGRTNTEDL